MYVFLSFSFNGVTHKKIDSYTPGIDSSFRIGILFSACASQISFYRNLQKLRRCRIISLWNSSKPLPLRNMSTTI